MAESRYWGPHHCTHHPGDLPEGTVRAIIRQARLSVDEFLEL